MQTSNTGERCERKAGSCAICSTETRKPQDRLCPSCDIRVANAFLGVHQGYNLVLIPVQVN